ncbi:APC membrane recruitment protein 3 [Pelodytes ibericus]
MELIRGKTFIKSYAQNPLEKLPSCSVTVKKNINSKGELNDCVIIKNESSTQKIPSRTCVTDKGNSFRKLLTSSKSSDCVTREHRLEQSTSETEKIRLPNSVSYPGADSHNRKRDNAQGDDQATHRQQMIDYRNFVPQLPFVPSVAKSLPRKRISLRRSKRSLRDIFSLKKNKQPAIAENERLGPLIFEMKEGQRDGENNQKMDSDERLPHELSDNEMHIEAAESCRGLCDDVASLKSFDSLTGCGEIFADENSAYINMESYKDGPKVMFITKASPLAVNFQGGVEKLASPAKSELIDFARLCGQASASARILPPSTLFDSNLLPPSNDAQSKERQDDARDQLSNSTYNDLVSSNENVHDAGSPISTSDEGYYDSLSPGMEDDKNDIDHSRSFPRDSYSGDALYELFCESKETPLTPSVDHGLSSLSEHYTADPMSVYSFCVGSEENMASQPENDLVGDRVLQNTWKGRDCFLKLCDTELSLTMGLVNWLRKTGKVSENQVISTSYQKEIQFESQGDSNNIPLLTSSEPVHEEKEKQLPENWQTNKEGCRVNIYVDEHSEHQRSIRSTQKSEEPSRCMVQKSPFFLTPGKLSHHQTRLIKTFSTGGQCGKEISKPDLYRRANGPSMHVLASMDVLSCVKDENQKTLQCVDLECVRNCASPLLWGNDKTLIQKMEQCATQVESMQIKHSNQNTGHENHRHNEKLTQHHEMSQNLKNSIEDHDINSNQIALHQALSYTNETVNKDLETEHVGNLGQPTKQICELTDSKKFDQILSREHTLKEYVKPFFTEGSKTQWFKNRTNFLPLFGSRSSSMISHCSSTLYKVCNSGETVIFLNTPNKCKNPLNKFDDLVHDSNLSSHVGSSKSKMDEFQSVTTTSIIRENGFANRNKEVD